MKLQKEYEYTKGRFQSLGADKVLAYAKDVLGEGNFNDFETRISWDIGRAAVGTNKMCKWYKEYNCNDSHIDTLFKKVTKEVFPNVLSLEVK